MFAVLKILLSSSSAFLSRRASKSMYLAWSSSWRCRFCMTSWVRSRRSTLKLAAVSSRLIFSSYFSTFLLTVLLAVCWLRARRTVRFSCSKLKDWPMMSTFLLRLEMAPKRTDEFVELDWLESSCSGLVGSPFAKEKLCPISVSAWLKSVQGCSTPTLGWLSFEFQSSLRSAPRSLNYCWLGGRILTGLLIDSLATSPKSTFLGFLLLTGRSSASSLVLLTLGAFTLKSSLRYRLSERWKLKYFSWRILVSMSTSSPFSLICLRRGRCLAACSIQAGVMACISRTEEQAFCRNLKRASILKSLMSKFGYNQYSNGLSLKMEVIEQQGGIGEVEQYLL